MKDRTSPAGGSPTPSGDGTEPLETLQKGNPGALEEDRARYERLRLCNFQGPEMDLLREDLWSYGWRNLRAWMRDGTIFEKCRALDAFVSARWTERETLARRADDRDEIAHISTERAVRWFSEKLLPEGAWDPAKGATMRTYFTGTCVFTFRDAFNGWSRTYRQNLLFTSDRLLVYASRTSPNLSYEDSVAFREAIQRILAGATPEVRAICGCLWEAKMSQKEIGNELGMTSRAVEGHMRRLRTRARRLVAKDEIDALYVRVSAAKTADTR